MEKQKTVSAKQVTVDTAVSSNCEVKGPTSKVMHIVGSKGEVLAQPDKRVLA